MNKEYDQLSQYATGALQSTEYIRTVNMFSCLETDWPKLTKNVSIKFRIPNNVNKMLGTFEHVTATLIKGTNGR